MLVSSMSCIDPRLNLTSNPRMAIHLPMPDQPSAAECTMKAWRGRCPTTGKPSHFDLSPSLVKIPKAPGRAGCSNRHAKTFQSKCSADESQSFTHELDEALQAEYVEQVDDEQDVSLVSEVAAETGQELNKGNEPVDSLTPSMAIPVTPLPTYFPSWNASPGGLVMACAMLVSISLGRRKAELDRLEIRSFQVGDLEYSSINKELMQRRKEYEEEEARRKAEEGTKRVEEAQRRAVEEEAKKREREKQYQEEQQKEAERIRAKKEVERKAFEAQEQKMKDELVKRTEVEKKIIEEMEAKRQAEEEQRRKEEEERQRQEAEAKRKAEEAERKLREEEERKRLEERKKLERKKKRFAIRAEGSVTVRRASRGKMTPGPLPREAKFEIEVKMKTAVGPEEQSTSQFFESHEDALESARQLSGGVARQMVDGYASAVRLQSIANTGPLEWMDELELEHWMRHAAVRAEILASAVMSDTQSAYQKGHNREETKEFQIRTEWGVLPKDNKQRTDFLLNTAIQALSNPEGKSVAHNILMEMIESESTTLAKDVPPESTQFLSSILPIAHFLDRAMQNPSQEVAEASAQFLQDFLKERLMGAKKDSLTPVSETVRCAMGDAHPVSAWMEGIALANMSSERKAQIVEKQRMIEAELKAKVLEEEWPDREEITAARVEEKEASTPVPERVWAMRNVARTLSMGNSGQSALNQAQTLMEKAIKLQSEFLGTTQHPAMLGPLFDYGQVLARLPGEEQQFVKVWEDVLEVVQLIGNKYRAQQDMLSGVICLESGVVVAERVLGERHPMVKKLSKTTQNWEGALEPNESRKVSEVRRSGKGFEMVMNAFTPELGAYKNPAKKDRIDQWDANEELKGL